MVLCEECAQQAREFCNNECPVCRASCATQRTEEEIDGNLVDDYEVGADDTKCHFCRLAARDAYEGARCVVDEVLTRFDFQRDSLKGMAIDYHEPHPSCRSPEEPPRTIDLIFTPERTNSLFSGFWDDWFADFKKTFLGASKAIEEIEKERARGTEGVISYELHKQMEGILRGLKGLTRKVNELESEMESYSQKAEDDPRNIPKTEWSEDDRRKDQDLCADWEYAYDTCMKHADPLNWQKSSWNNGSDEDSGSDEE